MERADCFGGAGMRRTSDLRSEIGDLKIRCHKIRCQANSMSITVKRWKSKLNASIRVISQAHECSAFLTFVMGQAENRPCCDHASKLSVTKK